MVFEYRIKVEHAICGLKCYKVMGTLWMHPRPKLKNLVKICAGFVNRRTYKEILQKQSKILGIYGKCMTQTKSMNHTNIHTGIKKTYIKTCIYLIVLKNLVKICAGFVNRRKILFND
jgi:hypothetical protein